MIADDNCTSIQWGGVDDMDVNQSYELYHFGVKGMKWGVRKAQKETAKAARARTSADEWDEMANYAAAKGNASKAAKYRQNAKQDRADAVKNDKKAKEYAANVEKARAAIAKYRTSYDKAEKASDAADAKWAEVQKQYQALGKNRVSRIINAARGKSDAAKQYNKSYDQWSNMQDAADSKWRTTKKLYQDTGRNRVERLMNQIQYDREKRK